MQLLFSLMNTSFGSLPARLLQWRWLVFSLFIGISALMVWGIATRFEMDLAPEAWFQDDAPALLDRLEFRRQFGSDDDVYIIFQPKSGDVFSEQALRTLEALHRELEHARSGQVEQEQALSRIVQVDSLYNARYQIADGDTLITRKLIGNDFPQTPAAREARRALAFSQDSFDRVFVSRDSQYGGIRLKTDFGTVPIESALTDALIPTDDLLLDDSFSASLDSSEMLNTDIANGDHQDQSNGTTEIEFADTELDEYLVFMTALRHVTNKPQYSDFKFYFVGNAISMDFTATSIIEAGGLLVAMVLIIVSLLWSLFRSFSAVIWPLLIIVLSSIWAIGLGSWLGLIFSTTLLLTLTLVLAVGIASCVHVFSSYRLFRRSGKDHHGAITAAYQKTGAPILLTSITTMVGMLSLVLSDMPVIQDFAITSGAAVGFTFLFIILLLPLLLHIWHPKTDIAAPRNVAKADQQAKSATTLWLNLQALLREVGYFTQRHAKTIVISYVIIFGLLVYGATQVKVDSNFAKLAKEGTPLQLSFDLADKKMMGGMALEVFMDFGHPDALKDPAVLKVIDRWQQHLEDKYPNKIIKTNSLADVVKNTNRVMNNDDRTFEVIPEDPRLAAQLLYLFDNANQLDRRSMVSDDYSRGRISFLLRNEGSHAYTAFFDTIDEEIPEFFGPLKTHYPNMQVKPTGTFYLMMELINHISWTQIKSFSMALLVITVLMMFALGSIQIGFVSMIPNLLPATFSVGILGLLDISLNLDTLVIAPIIIGIAVDDTIHFLAHYRNAWNEHGDVVAALQKTLAEVGPAVIFTSLILGIGFSVLGFSNYLGLAKPGILGSAAIFVALLSDLLFLPALLYWLKPNLGKHSVPADIKLSSSPQ